MKRLNKMRRANEICLRSMDGISSFVTPIRQLKAKVEDDQFSNQLTLVAELVGD